jgi:hypothetical protein
MLLACVCLDIRGARRSSSWETFPRYGQLLVRGEAQAAGSGLPATRAALGRCDPSNAFLGR